MVCLILELVGPWVVLGFNVGMEAFDELLSINVPWSQEFSLLWSFLAVGEVVQVACQGFLVREACVGVLVGGAGFLLSGRQWSDP